MAVSIDAGGYEDLLRENVLLREEVLTARKASDVKNILIEDQFRKVDGMLKQLEEKADKEHRLVQRLEEELRVSEQRKRELDSARTAAEQSLAALRQTREDLAESERMAAVGDLVAGVAFEINTPVGIGIAETTRLYNKLKDLVAEYRAGSGAVRRASFDKFLEFAALSLESVRMNLGRVSELIASFQAGDTLDLAKANLTKAAELIAGFRGGQACPGDGAGVSGGRNDPQPPKSERSLSASAVQDDLSVVYVKTEKGTEEIRTRRHGLPQKLRYILIVIDGKLTKRALHNLYYSIEGLDDSLDELERLGFIARRTP